MNTQDYSISLAEGYKVEEREKKVVRYVEHFQEEFTISHSTKGNFFITIMSERENHTDRITNIFYFHEAGNVVEDVELIEELNHLLLENF